MVRSSLVLMLIVGAAGAAPAANGTGTQFDRFSHDFGAVPRGPTVTCYFHVTNKTDGPVHIAAVRGSCHCLEGFAVKTELAKGENTTIVARVNTSRLSGPWHKSLFVRFDRPRVEEVRLTVQANVRDDLTLAPESLDFGRVRHGDSPERSVSVLISGSPACKILEAKAESQYVPVKVSLLRREAGEVSYRVTARLKPGLPVGVWATTVWLTTDNPAMLRLSIPVNVEVR